MALGCHDEGPVGPVQERDPQLGLELLHRLAGGRLGDEVLSRAARERPEPNDVAVEAESLEMHAQIIRVSDTYYPAFWGGLIVGFSVLSCNCFHKKGGI